jgi:predicted permease
VKAEAAVVSAYRTLLRLLPSDVRERDGEEMVATFAAMWSAAGGDWGRFRCFARSFGRLPLVALAEWGDHLSAARRRGPPALTRAGSLTRDVLTDVRYASRVLRRSPVFSGTVVLTVALGIGGTTAMFSFADEVLLKPLSVHAPEELVFVSTVGPDGPRTVSPPYPSFERIRTETESFSGMAGFAVDHLPLVVEGEPEQVLGQIASGSYFEVLGVDAALGRTFTAEDEHLPTSVAVLSHQYWQRRFAGSRDVLGKVVHFRDQALTIVGVTPPSFVGLEVGNPIDITIPITVAGEGMLGNERARWFSAVARVKPTVTWERARAEADAILQHAVAESGGSSQDPRTAEHIQLSAASHGVGRLRAQLFRPILLLAALMAGVLTIACANIANLLLARGAARRRELASRAAIGAGRFRIVRQLLTETLVLFTVGAGGGALLAGAITNGLADFLAVGRIPILLGLDLDARALAFSASLCLLTGMAAGVVPAIRASRGDAFADLRMRNASKTGARASMSRWLVVLQVAASAIILVDGGLLVRTLYNLKGLDAGFRSEGVLTLSVQPLASSSSSDEWNRSWAAILDRVEGVPGVEGASLSVLTPLSGRDQGVRIEVAGFQPGSDADLDVRLNYVSDAYFESFGIPVRGGRAFTTLDDGDAAKVALINEAAARFFFGDRSPVGMQIAVDSAGTAVLHEVIGVVGDVKHKTLREDAPRFLYLPVWQALDHPGRLTVSVRAQGDPLALVGAIREEIRATGRPNLVSDVLTMERQMDQALLGERLVSALTSALAALGVLLAAIGLYGLASYSVVRRTSEIGIRMALGSPAAAIRSLMMRETLRMVALGAGIGLPMSLLGGRAIRSLLYGVSPADPTTLAVSTGILGLIAGLAAFLPARRASRIDPAVTLTAE